MINNINNQFFDQMHHWIQNLMLKMEIGIPYDSLEMAVSFLNPDLADEYLVLTKTKNINGI